MQIGPSALPGRVRGFELGARAAQLANSASLSLGLGDKYVVGVDVQVVVGARAAGAWPEQGALHPTPAMLLHSAC